MIKGKARANPRAGAKMRTAAARVPSFGAGNARSLLEKMVRHRPNLHGSREANRALYVVALKRMRRDPRTQA